MVVTSAERVRRRLDVVTFHRVVKDHVKEALDSMGVEFALNQHEEVHMRTGHARRWREGLSQPYRKCFRPQLGVALDERGVRNQCCCWHSP